MNKTFGILFVILINVFSGFPAGAQVESERIDARVTNEKLFETYRNIPLNRLLRMGVTNIGELDIKKLQEEFKEVKVIYNPDAPIVSPDGLRKTAVYYPSQKMVILNDKDFGDKFWFGEDSVKQHISLHESLGALGYKDQNYQLSLAIINFAYRVDPKKDLAPMLMSNEGKIFKKMQQGRGGVTVTGGGGDGITMFIKDDLLLFVQVFESKPELWKELFGTASVFNVNHEILMARFEPNKDPLNLRIESSLRVNPIIWLPEVTWGSEGLNEYYMIEIIKEISKRVKRKY